MMRIAVAIVLLFTARFGVAAWFDQRHDADIGWQNWLGQQVLYSGHLPVALGAETFTSQGAPWVPQEWALSVAIAFALQHHMFAIIAVPAALAGVSVLLLTALAARYLRASALATAACVVCTGYSMVESYGVRAQVFAWAFLSAFMLVLRCASGRARWWLVPITVVWANVHGSVLLAPVILAIWTAGIAAEERHWNHRVRESAALTVAVAFAVLLTPLGIRLPVYAVELVLSPIRSGIQEWQPSTIASDALKFGFVPLLLGAAAAGLVRGRRYGEMALFVLSLWLAFSALRNIPIAAIIIAPFVAKRASALLPDRARVTSLLKERPAAFMLYGASALAALFIAVNLSSIPRFRDVSLPQRAVASAAALRGTHNLFCEDWAWCSLALKYTNVRTFLDGRCDAFPYTIWNEQQQVEITRGKWQGVLDRREVDLVLAWRNHRLVRDLRASGEWRERYVDSTYVLLERTTLSSRRAPA